MNKSENSWQQLGKLPSDVNLEARLDSLRHQNSNVIANQAAWLTSLENNLESSSAADIEYFATLEEHIANLA
jgi:hypothetical protein